MNRYGRFVVWATASLVALGTTAGASAGSSAGSSAGPRPVDLGTLGSGNFSYAWVMNDRGDIAGLSNTTPGSRDMHVVLWRDGRVIDVAGGVGDRAHPFGVNNRGQVVGCVAPQEERRLEAFVWEDGQLTMLGEGCAAAINESGQVVGARSTPDGSRAFLWQNGTMTDLPTPAGVSSGAVDINEQGQIIGSLSTSSPTAPVVSRAVIWDHGTVTELGTLGGTNSHVERINNRGQVIGSSDVVFEPSSAHPFVWERGRLTDLLTGNSSGSGSVSDLNDSGEVVGHLNQRTVLWRGGEVVDLGIGYYGYARAINERGQIVGQSGEYPGDERPYLWRDGQITYLDTLGGTYAHAADLDSHGRVAGSSTTPAGDLHAVVWITTSP